LSGIPGWNTWDTWSAIVGESKVPECGMFVCDEKVRVGNKCKCVKCGKVTTIEQELGE